MASKRNTLNSATNSIDTTFPADGYPLKWEVIKKWVYDHKKTQAWLARKLKLTPDEFKRKLEEREKFNEEQIRRLVRVMHAGDAFKAIYFPSVTIKNNVWWEVFGKYKNKEELNE